MNIYGLLNNVVQYILQPIVVLLFAIALTVFFYGIVKFIRDTGNGGDVEDGKRSIFWGIVGMFIMVSVYGIIRVLLRTFGIPNPPGSGFF